MITALPTTRLRCPSRIMKNIGTFLRTEPTLARPANSCNEVGFAILTWYWFSRKSRWPIGKILQAIWLNESLVVVRGMICSTDQNQIIWPIIGLSPVYVVDQFYRGINCSAKLLSHYKYVLANVSVLFGIGMAWFKKIYIASGFSLTSFPVWVCLAMPRSLWPSHIGSIHDTATYGYRQ